MDRKTAWSGPSVDSASRRARVTIDAGGLRQTTEVRSGGSYLSNNDVRAHFGLGLARQVDRLEIRWPNGRQEKIENVAGDQLVIVREGAGIIRSEKFAAR